MTLNPSYQNDRQRSKDVLWSLDEAIENLACDLTQSTGKAWREYVEHGNWKRYIDQALVIALDIRDKIEDAQDKLAEADDRA